MSQFCGIDIIEVERIKLAILETKGFKEKVFSAKEIEIGDKKSVETKYQYYAGRFAAKEAVYKALSKVYGDKLWLGDIEILNDSTCLNRPYVNLQKEDIKTLQKMGKIVVDVSISHIKETAISSAVVTLCK